MILGEYNKQLKNGRSLLLKVFYSNYFKLKPFKSKVSIYLETPKYIIKSAENNKELIEALALRYKIFSKEILGKRNLFKIDIDKFDKYCDHVIIIDKNINKVIGTYRINIYDKKFYSAKEFYIKDLLFLKGKKAELGRACILENYRKGVVLGLLWKGIYSYIEKEKIQYLFGCSSIFSENKQSILSIFNFFKINNLLHPSLLVQPKKKYSLKNLKPRYNSCNYNGMEIDPKVIPDLLKSYLKFGAKICSYPAYDRDFRCFDFLTMIDYHNINSEKKDIISRL